MLNQSARRGQMISHDLCTVFPIMCPVRRRDPVRLLVSTILAAGALVFAGRLGFADVLYGITPLTDELVIVDPNTGSITVVGTIGTDVAEPDIAILDGVLWAADDHHCPTTPCLVFHTDLLAINLNTGALLCSTHVTYQGADVAAEGLTAAGGLLRISFDPSNPSLGDSHVLSVISPFDGTITNTLDYQGLCTGESCEDLDALATNPAGVVYSFNVFGESFRRYSDLYQVGISPQTYTWLPPSYGSPSNPLGFNDFVFTTDRMFATNVFPNPNYQFCEFDPGTFQLTPSGCRAYDPSAYVEGLGAVGPPGTLFTLSVDQEAADDVTLSWGIHATSSSYDVIQGDLAALSGARGDYSVATDACLANDYVGTTVNFNGTPSTGDGYWFLARANPCGTYDSGLPSQVGARDAEIEASPNVCR